MIVPVEKISMIKRKRRREVSNDRQMKSMTDKKIICLLLTVIMGLTVFTGCGEQDKNEESLSASSGHLKEDVRSGEVDREDISEAQVPEYSGEPYVEINGNRPYFKKKEITDDVYEKYSRLDYLGRCGQAEACIGEELMPREERGSIGMIKPSGWHTVRYDDVVEGMYLYNRCHLIGYQLSGENANECNLITGTRYMNVEGMLPFEDRVAEYVESTGNHVMYRVTPVYEGRDLVSSGVIMEALSVEDDGRGIMFNVYVYNEQPGIVIDHATGESRLAKGTATNRDKEDDNKKGKYIINVNSGKFHEPDCSGVVMMNEENKLRFNGKRQKLIDSGYSPCGLCNP